LRSLVGPVGAVEEGARGCGAFFHVEGTTAVIAASLRPDGVRSVRPLACVRWRAEGMMEAI